MARLFRRDLGMFPHLDLVSITLGGFCGYYIGRWYGLSIEELKERQRIAEGILKKATDAKRVLEQYEEKRVKTLREMESYAKKMDERDRVLRKFQEHLMERERKVKSLEKDLIITTAFNSDNYASKSGDAGKEKSSDQQINLEAADNKLET